MLKRLLFVLRMSHAHRIARRYFVTNGFDGALTILGAQAEAQIRITVRHALEAGATKQEIAETIAIVGVFGGVPAMSKAMELASSVMETGKEDDA